MRIRVLFFGMLKELFDAESRDLELPQGSTIADSVHRLQQLIAAEDGAFGSIAYAVNRQYEPAHTVLHDGDELALLPPVSGGNQQGAVAIVRDPIVAADHLRNLSVAEDGAIVTFEGIVRNNTRGRETLFLDYSAYEDMALQQMQALVAQARMDHSLHGVVVLHRLGRLQIGETSVLIAVTSPHRAQAFVACRWLIDTLKQTVPIWKKEHFTDGAVWAAGEPFPEAILR